MDKYVKAKIRKLARGQHTVWTIKNFLKIDSDIYDDFIRAELQKRIARLEAQPFYAGRNIRY